MAQERQEDAHSATRRKGVPVVQSDEAARQHLLHLQQQQTQVCQMFCQMEVSHA